MDADQKREIRRLAARLVLRKPNLQLIPDTEDFPWFVREFQKQLQALETRRELLLPNLRQDNESIAVFSDYGGESPDSKYNTYSFLVCAWNQTGFFHKVMGAVREKHGLNSPFKEIAFKDFRYGPIQRALPEYLSALSNLVNGYLLTVVVEKSVPSIYGINKKESQRTITQTLHDSGFGDWKPEIAEKLLRIAHFSAYLIALLSRDGQKVLWMTDHDAIASTEEKFNNALALFQNLLNHYSPHKYALVGGALPFAQKDPMMLDLLSAPDVVAGSVEHYMTRSVVLGPEDLTVKEEANSVLRWLAGQGVALKKHAMLIKYMDGALHSSSLVFRLKDPDTTALYVPVHVE